MAKLVVLKLWEDKTEGRMGKVGAMPVKLYNHLLVCLIRTLQIKLSTSFLSIVPRFILTMTSSDSEIYTSDAKTRPMDSTLDAETGKTNSARLDEFGKLLVPTPTSDPLDPLNWTNVQKYTIMSIVCFSYFLLTYFTTAPVPSFTLLQLQFNATYSQVNWTLAIPCLGLATGPLLLSALGDIYGRRVVMIVGTMVALVSSGCTSIHGISFTGYLVARFFQGFGIGPAANIGLSIVNDISWEHERGFRVGLWAMSANMGTLVGGLGQYIAKTLTIH